MSKFFSNLLSDLNLRSSKFDERKLYPPQVLYYTINELRLQVSVTLCVIMTKLLTFYGRRALGGHDGKTQADKQDVWPISGISQ
jgi:hypothetical protein